ncbi:MAG: SAM-dependent methyltransferase [Chthoniobacterales bacterium]
MNNEPSSFKDPSGHVFYLEGQVHRRVNKIYKEDYDLLMRSGLYEALTKKNLLVEHQEVEQDISLQKDENCYKIIRPQQIDFISYPYEWCFSQLKKAALLTLRIQEIALEHGMSLKDATPYNVQFAGYRPIFIDTLSFEKLDQTKGWVAYRQFAENFLAVLSLISYTDIGLSVLPRAFFHGVPLSLTNKLLPAKAFLNIGLLIHIKAHSKLQNKYANSKKKIADASESQKMTPKKSLLFIQGLKNCVKKINPPKSQTEWGDYYNFTNYSDKSFKEKHVFVENFLKEIKPEKIWDIGGNRGEFSRIGLKTGAKVLSSDIDPIAVEQNYLQSIKNKETDFIAVLQDITNPSPSIGWRLQERQSLIKRWKPDCVMSLALIHHLVITYNIPLQQIVEFYSEIAEYLIIEFIPKGDSQIQKLLLNRKDVFSDYEEKIFSQYLKKYYEILKTERLTGSLRTLFLCQRKG